MTAGTNGRLTRKGTAEPPAIQKAEEFEALGVEALKSADNWVHHRHHILKQGRCTPFKKPEEEESDDKKAVPEEDPEEEQALLKSVAEDAGDRKKPVC